MSKFDNMTREELAALVEKLEAGKPTGGIKVAAKGGVSVYGVGRFPVTLYSSQWDRLLSKADEIRQFIADHDSELAHKPEKE